MDKEELNRLVADYGLDPSIINDIYENLHQREDVSEEDVSELLELICFDYMHLDIESSIEEIPDHEITSCLSDDELTPLAKEIIEEKFDRVNDLSSSLEAIIEANVSEYLDRKNGKKDPNSLIDIYNS